MLDAHAMPIHLTLAAMNAEPPSDTPELDGLFEKLRTGSAEDRAGTRGRIWAIWCSHPEDDAVHAMRSAVSALETGNLTNAGATLDDGSRQWPKPRQARGPLALHRERLRVSRATLPGRWARRHLGGCAVRSACAPGTKAAGWSEAALSLRQWRSAGQVGTPTRQLTLAHAMRG